MLADGKTLPLVTPPPAVNGTELIIGLRPEAFSLAEGDAGVEVTAQLVESSGSDTFVTTELGGKAIVARLPGRSEVAAHGALRLAVDTSHACFFDPASGLNLRAGRA
jgi:multiple sugar transport system ATP-binding protein